MLHTSYTYIQDENNGIFSEISVTTYVFVRTLFCFFFFDRKMGIVTKFKYLSLRFTNKKIYEEVHE